MDIQTQKKLDYLEETKQLLRTAIEEKGQTINDLDPFRSYVAKVRAITTGGGSADLRYVTFMNDDGTVEYGRKPTAVGDDCADPIARGVFDTPTKESTAQYNYTFAGWATTPGGGIDANALKAVDEDRTVYANFISVLRYYTITYYDSDGVTVLKTETLAYGDMPSYEPVKIGFIFEGWKPSAASVTGDANYVAQWKAQSGLVHIVTIPRTMLGTAAIKDVTINNAGTFLVATTDEGKTIPSACYIENGNASLVNVNSGVSYSAKYNACAFESNDEYFKVVTFATSGGYKIHRFQTDGNTIVSRTLLSGKPTRGDVDESPVDNIYSYDSQDKNFNNQIIISNGIIIPVNQTMANNAFSPDGVHIAHRNKPVQIFRIKDGALVHSFGMAATPTKISYNEDGSLIALSFSDSPYLQVYETTNYTLVADFSSVLSDSTKAEFVGLDWIIAGVGSTVQAFEITASGAKAFEYDIPSYTGGTIAGMVKNHANKHLVLWDSDNIEVWAKK